MLAELKKRARTVGEYVRGAPKEVRGKLLQLRKLIKAVAPKAEERISYGIPYYGYKGRLAYFQYATSHIGLYIPPPVIQQHERELKSYETATATVRFPLGKALPVALIRKLIKARLAINEQKAKR